MDIQELVSLNREVIKRLPEAEQAGALRRLVLIVEGDDVETELPAFMRLLRRQIASGEQGDALHDGLPIYKLPPADIEAVEEHDRQVATGIAEYASRAEAEAEMKGNGDLRDWFDSGAKSGPRS